jgi:hypothetical protein
LAYYWDHAEELDEDIERRAEKVEEIRQAVGASPLRDRLKVRALRELFASWDAHPVRPDAPRLTRDEMHERR